MIIQPEIFITKYLHPDDAKKLDEHEKQEKELFKIDSIFDEIRVVESPIGRFIKFHDSYQAGILNYEGYQANVPYLNYFLLARLFKKNIEKILILGMGSGNSATCFEKICPELKKIDIVEIDPAIAEIAKNYFDFKQSEKTKINFQDARVFVRTSREKYDLVLLDIFSDSGMPYRFMTKEFLEEVDSILTPDGILAANIFSSTEINSGKNIVFKAMLKSYKEVFKDIKLFPTDYGNDELYRKFYGLKHELSDITNMIIFASKSDINLEKDEIIHKAVDLKGKFDFPELKNLDKYAEDIYESDVEIDNVKILTDEFEEMFTSENIEKFLGL